eukprot:Phypoly_transcript_05333.p1 GENE.Phypoly_transcript_05333~~Phypoly_transcript_05333.p1  ORF type:complete len:597 (+),score=121.94 Phypoly_transcript_05333:56-1846(+)
MYSVGRRAGARTVVCYVSNRTGVRWASAYDFKLEDNRDIETSSQAGERHLTIEEREQQERKLKKDIREAHRQRLMGKKKEVVESKGRKIDKKRFENLMMPLVEKHLLEKRSARQTELSKLHPIPQTYTEDEQDFIDRMIPTDPDELKQEKGETDDDFWERRSLAMLPKYDWLNPDLERARKPGRDYASIARKLQLSTFGDPDAIKNYMRYPDQKAEFIDERHKVVEPTTLEDVKEHEIVMRIKEKRDGRDYANNIQRMYNRVQKFKAQRALEMEAMGVKPPVSPVANSKFAGKHQISAAVILERYPTLTPPDKPHEIEHEEWVQNVREKTCFPVIPWYIWKMQWEKLTEGNKKKQKGGDLPMGARGGSSKDIPKEERGQKKKSKDNREKRAGDDLPRLNIGPPDWGLPNVKLPELSPEDALEQQKADERKLQPYNEWIEYWKNWKAAPRETQDDLDDNRKSTNRALHKKLYLIVKRKNDGLWTFPSATNKDDESIRKTAERGLTTSIGKDLTVYFHSNAPVGFYNSYFPTEQEQEKQQAESDKIFYMRARYFRGTPDPMRRAGLNDYLWVTREQLAEYLPKDYHDRVINFIWPDPN